MHEAVLLKECHAGLPLTCWPGVASLTTVPKAKTDEEAATGALALAHDCQAAYSQAAEKAKDPELKQALEKFASQSAGQIDQWRGESSGTG